MAYPTVGNMVKAIVARVGQYMPTGVVVSPHWRVQGDPVPAVTYDLVSAEWWNLMSTGGINGATVVMTFSCVAQDLATAMSIADRARWAIITRYTGNLVTFQATNVTYRTADVTPDDGTGDRERVVVVTATITAQDENTNAPPFVGGET